MNMDDFNTCQKFINRNCSFVKSKEYCCKFGYEFQTLSPACVTLLSELIGLYLSNNLPENLQNVAGNVLQCIGTVLTTYNAQQVYFENGPGLCFNPKNLNINNPDCQKPDEDTTQLLKTLQQQIQDLQKEITDLKRSKDDFTQESD